MRRFKTKSRLVIGLGAAAMAFSTVYAMAASLGGITNTTLGADAAVTSSCDTDGVSTSYTTSYDATDERYEVTSVTVSGIDNNCDGKSMKVTLTQSTGASLGEATATIASDTLSTSSTASLSTAVAAASVTDVHVIISG